MERHEFGKFQAEMKSAILSGQPTDQLIDVLTPTEGLTAQKRLQIHQNNFRETLSASLAGVFPALEAFVGPAFVRGALGEFCVKNPPVEAALNGYGSEFADFLDNHPASEQVPYAADIVRLEWAVHELQLVEEIDNQLEESGAWQLSANARFIESEFPLLTLWSVANKQLPPEAVSLDQGGQTVVALLLEGEVSLLVLTHDEASVVNTILNGQNSADEKSFDVHIIRALQEKNIIMPA